MSEVISASNVNLHEIDALQRVAVRDGISLRPMDIGDADRLLSVLEKDPSIREHVSIAAKMHSRGDVEKQVAEMQADPECIRYVITDEEDECNGLVSFWLDPGFFGQTPLPNTYGFGYFLDPDQRGRGIVTQSVQRLMETAEKNIPKIEGFTAFCVDGNAESVAVLEKLGFRPTEKLYSEPDHGWLERQYVRGLFGNG